jgi:hypothetical protein
MADGSAVIRQPHAAGWRSINLATFSRRCPSHREYATSGIVSLSALAGRLRRPSAKSRSEGFRPGSLRDYEGTYKTGVHAPWNVADSAYQGFKMNG